MIPGSEARGWVRTIDESRRAAIRTLQRVERRRHLPVLAFPALWVGAGIVAVTAGHWWLRVPAIVLCGVLLHGIGIVMHEAIHGNLFRQAALDRLAAFAAGIPLLVSGAAYRVTHLAHHRHNRGEMDPDEFAYLFRGRTLQAIAFWVWALFSLPIFIAHVAMAGIRRGAPPERRAVVAEYLAITALHGAAWTLLAAAGRLDILVRAWLFPLLVTWPIVSLRGWSEHMLTRPEHPLTRTRTITSNRGVSLLLLNLNFHLEHHLFPGVPWYNLPRLHTLLRAEYRAAGSPIYRSYSRFLWDAARRGIHGLAPKPQTEER